MVVTFDLFAEEPVCEISQPVPAGSPDPGRLLYVLEPAGLNRWTYKGELLRYDTAKHTVPGRGRWSTIESVGKPEIRGHSHVEICMAIDARQGGAV
jgi:hypothetical protein